MATKLVGVIGKHYAGVAELVDARRLGRRSEWIVGSIPAARTKLSVYFEECRELQDSGTKHRTHRLRNCPMFNRINTGNAQRALTYCSKPFTEEIGITMLREEFGISERRHVSCLSSRGGFGNVRIFAQILKLAVRDQVGCSCWRTRISQSTLYDNSEDCRHNHSLA